MMHCVRKTNTPVGFATGGGAQQGDKSLAFEDSRVIPPDEQAYVLNECPPAQSIGKTVIDRGYLFIWDPRENVPYLVPPSRRKLRVPRRSRINASRVVESYHSTMRWSSRRSLIKPRIFDRSMSLVLLCKSRMMQFPCPTVIPSSLIHPSPPQVPEEEKEHLNALIDDVVQEIKVASSRRNEKPVRPSPRIRRQCHHLLEHLLCPHQRCRKHPDDERRLVFAEGGELRDEPRLRAEASSPEHQRTHFPKNPFCKICNIAKNTSMRVARKPGGRNDDLLDAPTAPYQQLAADSLAKGDEHVGIGIGGIKSHHVIRDVFSGARVAYPVSKRDIPSHARNLRHFIGLRANELAPHCLIKMDEAGELQGAAEEAGMIPETTLPNRWPHNSELERDVREEKECCRSIHHLSGLSYSLLSHSYPFACLSISFDRPSTFDPKKMQWEALTKEKFDGVRCCFGQLVWYRLKSARKRTLESNMAPGLLMGWRIDPGMRYRRVLKVMDYQSFRTNGNVTVHDVPEPELFVEENRIAAAADRALRTGDCEVPEYAIRDVPFIPEGIPAPSTPSGFKSRSVYITIERIIKFKETPGCKACTGHASSRHHTDDAKDLQS